MSEQITAEYALRVCNDMLEALGDSEGVRVGAALSENMGRVTASAHGLRYRGDSETAALAGLASALHQRVVERHKTATAALRRHQWRLSYEDGFRTYVPEEVK